MTQRLPPVFVRHDPAKPAPLVFDSPHSGNHYPEDFDFSCPETILRQAEDSFVDDLYANAPAHGAILIAATFPRSYIDVNRAVDDIDPQLIATPWPGTVRPSEKSRVGMGLIRRICRPGLPVYDHKLTVPEIQHRIETYYHPYHAALKAAIDETVASFGAAWHINCHSMPSSTIGGQRSEWERADFVLGNRDGATCDVDFIDYVAAVLTQMGYTVRINDPYKGVEIVRRYGKPAHGVNSLQIEVNRRLYMNEETIEKTAGYAKLKRNLTKLISALNDYTHDQLLSAAAD